MFVYLLIMKMRRICMAEEIKGSAPAGSQTGGQL